jgi:hypothetical protein
MGVIEGWDISSSEICFKWELNGVQIPLAPPKIFEKIFQKPLDKITKV